MGILKGGAGLGLRHEGKSNGEKKYGTTMHVVAEGKTTCKKKNGVFR